MTQFGIDYAWGDPGVAALKTAGVHFVCRYVSTPGNKKNLRADEAKGLTAAGISVVVVFESTAGRSKLGRAAGLEDGLAAHAQAIAAGAPTGVPIYFAVDFDATEGDQAAIDAYLAGAAAALGKQRVGVYGSYYVVKRALDAGACTWAWQTYAWSGGQWDDRAHLRQYANGQTLNGVGCDFNHAMKADYGQWPRPKSAPAPTPAPTPAPAPAPAPVPAPAPAPTPAPKTETTFMLPDWFLPWLRWYVLDRSPDTKPDGVPDPEPQWAWDVVGAASDVHLLLGPPTKYTSWRDWVLVDGKQGARPPAPDVIPDAWWTAANADHAAMDAYAKPANDAAAAATAKAAQAVAQVAALQAKLDADEKALAAAQQDESTTQQQLAVLEAQVANVRKLLADAQAALGA